jgi:hypothetical protein
MTAKRNVIIDTAKDIYSSLYLIIDTYVKTDYHLPKRYFKIEQHLAQHFVYYV